MLLPVKAYLGTFVSCIKYNLAIASIAMLLTQQLFGFGTASDELPLHSQVRNSHLGCSRVQIIDAVLIFQVTTVDSVLSHDQMVLWYFNASIFLVLAGW